MDDRARLSSLIGDIYDASLDPGIWPAVLEKTANFVGGGSCNLSSTDTAHSAVDIHVDWGSDPYYVELMATQYAKIYPLPPLLMAYSNPGDVVSVETLMPYGEFIETRFFTEWAKPQQMCDAIGAVLEKSATRFAAVSVMRFDQHGVADNAARERMALLGPHYRRAVAISNILEQRAFEAQTLANTLDGLAAGIFMIDHKGEVIRANVAGERMLEDGALLRTVHRKLVTTDPRANGALQEALLGATGGDVLLGAKGIALPLTEAMGERWIAHILPMTAGTRREPSGASKGMAALFVQKVALDRPPALEAIAKQYRLTPSELRVLLAVVDSGSVSEMAPILGIAESTVRTHLHRVFEKTGTGRQSDLVRLLASFASPTV